MIRAFLAINLPVRLVEKIRRLQRDLRGAARDANMKVAWVPAPNMHMTLKFLGNIDEENAEAVRDALAPALEPEPPLELEIRGVGAFPTAHKPRVLWVGVHCAGDRLQRLAQRVDERLAEIGFAREQRPLHPHVTLGRVKRRAADLLGHLEQPRFGECTVHDVVLYKSVLQRAGAEYTPLARFHLSGAAPEPSAPDDDEAPGEDRPGRPQPAAADPD